MPLEVVVELQIRAISCPGVFLPDKKGVYLGVYLLNQYLETDCFPAVFPITIQQNMRFEKVFENAIDPGAVADILESFLTRFELVQLSSPVWEELAYYEENARDFLFPEPKLRPSHPGMHREVLMKTAIGFPGIAPKLEFSTRTAIRECMFPQRNRFLAKSFKSQKPVLTSQGQTDSLNNRKMKLKEKSRFSKGALSLSPSPFPTRRFFLDQSTQLNCGNPFGPPGEKKPPFVVRHVDSEKPFGENKLEHYPQKPRRKPKFTDFLFPTRRASSLDSLAANVKVIKEPDDRILVRSQLPSPLGSCKFRRPSLSHRGDADFHRGTPLTISQNSRSPSPVDQFLFQERSYPRSSSRWKNIHERVQSVLTSHRAHPKEQSTSEANDIFERPGYPLKKYPLHEQRYKSYLTGT